MYDVWWLKKFYLLFVVFLSGIEGFAELLVPPTDRRLHVLTLHESGCQPIKMRLKLSDGQNFFQIFVPCQITKVSIANQTGTKLGQKSFVFLASVIGKQTKLLFKLFKILFENENLCFFNVKIFVQIFLPNKLSASVIIKKSWLVVFQRQNECN